MEVLIKARHGRLESRWNGQETPIGKTDPGIRTRDGGQNPEDRMGEKARVEQEWTLYLGTGEEVKRRFRDAVREVG